jgi:hypothetical protein
MAMNANYQLTDGAAGAKKTTKKSVGSTIAGGASSVAQLGSLAKNVVNNAGRYGGVTAPAAGYHPRSTATKTAGASTHKNSGGSGGSSGGGGGAAPAAPSYQQSQVVTDAYAQLQSLQAPTYNNQFEGQLNSLYEQILNRPKFKYNVNADALYQQYKDQYMQGGKTAMQDTMAQASALTGGYGNSYAQTAGQQQYQNYLQELNNQVPTLANMAYSRYQDEGTELRQNYGMTKERYDDVYQKFRDDMSDYQANRSYLASRADAERDYDLTLYRLMLGL